MPDPIASDFGMEGGAAAFETRCLVGTEVAGRAERLPDGRSSPYLCSSLAYLADKLTDVVGTGADLSGGTRVGSGTVDGRLS